MPTSQLNGTFLNLEDIHANCTACTKMGDSAFTLFQTVSRGICSTLSSARTLSTASICSLARG